MTSRKVVIAGDYGFDSMGSEAILSVLIGDLRRLSDSIEIVVVSGNPDSTAAHFQVKAVEYRNITRIISEIESCNLVILGGGGLFQDYWGFDPSNILTRRYSNIAYYTTICLLATVLDKPLMLYAVGVGPLSQQSSREHTRLAFEQARAATVRDLESKDMLVSFGLDPRGVEVSADPAYRFNPAPKQRVEEILEAEGFMKSGETIIGVSLRNWTIGTDSNHWMRQVAQGLDEFLSRHKARAIFIPFQNSDSTLTDDLAISSHVIDQMQEKDRALLIWREYSVSEKAGLIAACDLVLGMRLHSIIFAANASVPSVGLIYDEKIRIAMKQLKSDAYALDLSSITASGLLESLERLQAERKLISKQIEAAQSELSLHSERNHLLLAQLLAKQSEAPKELSGNVEDLLKRTVLNLASQIENRESSIEALKSDAASKQPQTAEKQRVIISLQQQLLEKESEILSLNLQLADKGRAIETISVELSEKDKQLERIRSSLGGRLLNLYGPIKYRYLLPLYRLFKLISQESENIVDLPPQLPAPDVERIDPHPLVNYDSNLFDIICFPVIEWDFRFQRPQQLMLRFAASGHRVFYIKPRFRPSGEPYLIEEKIPNLYEVSLRGPDLNVYRDRIDRQSFDIIFASLDALRRDLSVASAAVIVQLPFWWPLAKQAGDACAWPIIYDCMDFHAGFSTNTQQMIAQEEELLGAANLVIVSSSALEREARKHNSNVTVVRNGCDFDHFNLPVKSARSPHAVIGYYGAIADWFDSDLVADLAEKRPDWDFVLVGSTFSADISRLSKLPNVSMPGEKPYSEIPDWLAQFDVTIIPFRQTPLTAATNPVKAYEILASGKPIVSVPLPEIAPLSPLIRLASTAEEFEKEILSALDESDPEMVERRRDFARSNTWDVRFRQLAPAIKETFPKASIIIVTYNNLELNRLCLESVYKRTEWPRFEVIVVDNASSDATPHYLKEAEKRFPNLHVILNTENRGFAAANNQALKIATGDYLVLLNNDTVAPRGWLWSLIKHLHSDPGIGLVGPVTNEIGNEAKIPVGYTQLEDMPVWAAEYARQNDGEIFHIPVLAMFCVAMRREVFERVGPLDESFQIGMFEDDDYTRRMREDGYRVVCARDAFMHHAGRASFKLLTNEQYLSIFERNRRVYEEKWGLWEPHMDQKNSKRIPALCERLNEIIARSKIDPGRIVIFLPSIGWNTPLHQRPHHLAKGLARLGYLVFFDCTGSVIDDFADFVPVEQNLWLYKGPKGVLDSLENPVIWTLPYNAHLTDRWPAGKIVYDLIDDLSVFPYRQGMLSRNHKRMLERADMVLYVARKLESEVSGRSDALYFPNGVEFKRFASPDMNGEQDFRFTRMLAEGRPVLGYYGAIASWLNLDMLMEVAQMRKDWSLVIIGQKLPDAPSLARLSEMENVLILGPQRYESLPAYLSRFSAAMIPFKINQITEATSPLKLFEYFAGGKPVISAPMPECAAFEDVLIARDAREFSQAMDVALHLSGDAAFRRRLQTLARENSWEIRIREFMKLFEEKEAGKSRATFSSSDEGGRGKVKGKRA